MFPLKDTILHLGFPSVTWALIILNGAIFLFEISIPKDILGLVFYHFGLVPARYSYPRWAYIHGLPFDDYLSLLTNMFLHEGWLHIIGNMWFLHLFGSTLEDRLGHGRFLIFYFLSGIAASVTYLLVDIHSMIPAFGASGAIAGVMGGYIVMFPRARIITLVLIFFIPVFVQISALVYIGLWFFMQLLSGTLTLGSPEAGGGVAWWGHIGGFVAGIVLLPFFRGRGELSRNRYPDETYHYLNQE
jgi:membrane associated rhomboid family serine protease